MIADPPFDDGSVHDSRTCPEPAPDFGATAGLNYRRAEATVRGITLLDGEDGGPVPVALVAATTKA